MASAFKWKLTDKPNNLFSYLTDENAGLPQINSGLTASAETVISQQVVTNFGNEQAYADQFEIMKGMIASNPATSGVTLLNYIYYYDMDENSCGLLNGGGGGTTSKGEKGDKGDPGERGPQGPQGIQGIQGRGISNITTTPLTGGTGNRVEVILTDGTTEHFDVMNGSVDYEYLQTLVESAVTVEVQNVSAYVKNSIVQYVSGELSSFTHIIQDASSITAEVVSRVSGLSMDMSKLQMTATAITATVVNLSGDVSTMTQSIQTASGIAWSAQRVANSANSQCADLKVSYSAITSQVEQISSGMVTHSEITQLAERITLNVYNELNEKTGINIEDGTITLDAANTKITGTLSLIDGESGFILFDNGRPSISIQNKPIGNDGTTSWEFYNQNFLGTTTAQINNIQGTVEDFYYIQSGITYNINHVIGMVNIFREGATQYINIEKVTANLDIKQENGTVIRTLISNKTIYVTPGDEYFEIGNGLNFTSNYSGIGKICLNMDVKFGQNYNAGVQIIFKMKGYIERSTNNIVKLGNDGLLVVNGINKFCRFKSDEYLFRQENSSIKITSDNITRSIGAAKGDIGSIVKVRTIERADCDELASNELQEDDGFVIFTGNNWERQGRFYLPDPSNEQQGRIIYFKNLTNTSIMFGTLGVKVIDAHKKTPDGNHVIDGEMCYWICGGGYWFLGYCG